MSKRLLLFILLPLALGITRAQSAQGGSQPHEQLKFVAIVTRHGVRSPTGKAEQYSAYASAPWPAWGVQPGYLTEHGFREMKLQGAYERIALSADGLLQPSGCSDTASVTIHADSDQRTLETGQAFSEGLFPDCEFDLVRVSDGANDPLFHAPAESLSMEDRERARAAISVRIHNDPASLTELYRPELQHLDSVLAGCGGSHAKGPRTSVFDVPASLTAGADDHAGQLKGPLFTASTLSEIFLLEYAEGMSRNDVGWGCLNPTDIRALIHLHTAAFDYAQRTKEVAELQGRRMMDGILSALKQAATGLPDASAPSRVSDRLLVLAGHDTNLANLAGMLDLHWQLDGRADDTPPGSALVFQLWQDVESRHLFVRIWFQTPTLEQIREETPLTAKTPPLRQNLTVAGCNHRDRCTLEELQRIALSNR